MSGAKTVRSEFEPSRERLLPAVLATTAAGAQRSGPALPSFLPLGISTERAIEIAQLIDPSHRTLELAFSLDNRRVIEKVASSPNDVEKNRRKVIRQLTLLAGTLQPAQQRLAATFPRKSQERKLHIPLIAFLANRLGYEDENLPIDLAKGVNITGEIPHRVCWENGSHRLIES